MISTRIFAAALVASTGMVCPAISNAQLLGNSHMAGRGAELQSDTAASINADLSGASEAQGNPADAGREPVRQARRQTQDRFGADHLRASRIIPSIADTRTDNLRAMIDLEAKGSGTTALSADVAARINDDNH